ncbi:hypothetical protein WM40_06780 [Robbsia andropogonis]|uniref:Flagellin N-terminal domain-containing protein n=1 Tax=Robbsia andropogonis TaxID=28092 RepID=A0A0F5K2W0_9BURK|nr:flagellar hook-associated protein FlgL [Robbsia andropogonis]KKB64199.1 hypothetical protein WM40_06780 [Robbsia andropogonis]MCP1118759.1 flagellar hook-associated protein FlgL [Robbsia andropogonis]MCP1128226.1 flagellar hook-associated protein FlgL [Robbsia andropogonis]
MRIATNTLYSNSLDTIDSQQKSLADLQKQIASGKRVATAADDPQAAASAVRMTETTAKLGQYASNLNIAKSQLQLEDNTLSNVTTLVQQAQTLLVNAGDTSLDKTSRAALATQLESVRDQLLGMANTTDSEGNYLFGGYNTGTAPFSTDANGRGIYMGSPGQRAVQVTDTRQITIGNVGSNIFQRVSVGASRVVTAPASNTGNALASPISSRDMNDPAYNDDFSISFAKSKDGGLRYTIHDETTKADIAKDQPFDTGSAIVFAGQSITINGTPEPGDTVRMQSPQSAGMDIFSTLTQAAKMIRNATSGSEGNARLANALSTANQQVVNALDNVLTVQAGVGAREQEVATLSTQNTDSGTQYQTQLNDLTGSDFVSTYSKFSELQNSLTAAEKTFMQVQNLSLFDLIK